MASTTDDRIDRAELARCLFEESNDALFVFDPVSLHLEEINPSAQEFTRLSRDELLNKSVPELFERDDERLLLELLESCQQTRTFHSREAYRLLRSDRDPLEVNVTVSRLHTRPNTLGLIAVRDVSRRRSIEIDLQFAQSMLKATIENQAVNLQTATAEIVAGERRIRELLDDVTGIVWEAELPDWQFTFVSNRAEAILGYSVQQWLEEPDFWVNHIHPDDVQSCFNACRSAMARGQDQEFDYRAIAADGRIVWLRDTVHVVKDEDGTPVKLRGVMADISDHIEAEQFRSHLAAIVGSTVDGIYSTDTKGTIVSWNVGAEELFGYRADEMIGADSAILVSEGRCAAASIVCAGQIVRDYETTRKRKDGSLIDVALTAAPIHDDDGQIVGVSAVVRDITARLQAKLELERARDELRISEAKYRTIVNTTQEWIWEIDSRGVYVFSNPAIDVILGYSADDIVGNRCGYLMHEHDRTIAEQKIPSLMASGSRWLHWVSRWQHKDGSIRYLESNAQPIYDDKNCVSGFRGAERDITARIKAEELLQTRERELAHVSRLTTMGEMVAGIAHEVNQPLSAISNFASAASQVLKNPPRGTDTPVQEWMERISEQAIRCGDIIRRLRRFTRKEDSARVDIDIESVLRESVAILDAPLREQGVSVITQWSAPPCRICGNATELQQVFVNLIRNAMEAAANSTSALRTICISGSVEEKFLRISVEDNGTGIEKANVDRLFAPFFTTRADGMGMGLAISRSIIENHEGRLWLARTDASGTRFSIELPIATTTQHGTSDVE